ncbi:cupin domain-containing protein [Paenisporosarcina indica]|uniref:cupin domain-containing protein n=1 Tax=Paenisporosarcina indica TaxID=650093 RepID=UPI001FE8711C|nr:cupin domain-containing protein [Paenisporosarcina indica]
MEETLTLVEGQVNIILETEEVTLEIGETLVFSGNQLHRYENACEKMSVLHLIIHYQYV